MERKRRSCNMSYCPTWLHPPFTSLALPATYTFSHHSFYLLPPGCHVTWADAFHLPADSLPRTPPHAQHALSRLRCCACARFRTTLNAWRWARAAGAAGGQRRQAAGEKTAARCHGIATLRCWRASLRTTSSALLRASPAARAAAMPLIRHCSRLSSQHASLNLSHS